MLVKELKAIEIQFLWKLFLYYLDQKVNAGFRGHRTIIIREKLVFFPGVHVLKAYLLEFSFPLLIPDQAAPLL